MQPLTVESFAAGLRKKPPAGINPKLWSDDSIIEWAESEPSFKTYFEPKINNPKPYNDDGSPNYMHDPSLEPGTLMPNKAYIQDIEDHRASKDPEHLKYLGFNIEQMSTDFGSWLSGNVFGYMQDPEGLAKSRTNALEILADKTKWLGVTGLYTKGLAKLSKGMELDKDSPEYNQARQSAREWYDISQAYIETGNALATQRMAESPELRGYFRWMDKNPMRHDNFFHAEQFQRSMAEMSPSVAAMLAATIVTGGGALVAGATMFALEGSGMWAEGMRLYTEEGIPVKDENGKPVIDPKTKQQVREKLSFEDAAPIVGQTSLVYSSMTAPLETFQVGRASRLLKFAPEMRRSFILKMFDKTVRRAPKTAQGVAWVADFGIEAIEGGAIEWLQTVTQMAAMKAMEEGYGDNPKQALEALAEKLGPMEFTKFMFSEEGGMSDDAKQSFWLGLSGEAGFGAIGGTTRRLPAAAAWAYGKARKKKPDTTTGLAVIPEEDSALVPTDPPVTTDGDQALALVQSPDKTGSAVGYANMLVSQATEGSPYYASGVNMIISKAGGAGDDKINDLINRDSKRGLEERPERKAFNLLKSLENEPEIRKQVLDVINQNPILQAGVVAIDKDSVKNKLPQEDQGTGTTTTQSEDVIDDIDTDEWTENMDNIEELVNAKLDEQGLAKLTVKAEKEYESEPEDDDAPPPSSDAEDIAAGKMMGLQGTDAQILAEYRKQISKTEKKTKKVTPTKNINKESAPLQHLKDVQQQSGDAGVKAILKGNKKKKIPQANLTTLNVLQNELFPEEARLTVNTKNRKEIIERIANEVLGLAPKGTLIMSTAPHKRKAPIKKKSVKRIAKKKPITAEEVVPDTGKITVFRDKEKSTIKVENATDNVAGAIQVQLTGLDASDPTGKSTPIKDADTLIVPGDQAGLIKQMQQMNVPGADKITVSKDGKVDYIEADGFIQEFFKDNFKHIRYNNKQLPQKDVEFFDLSDGKSYSVSPDIAKAYGDQRKGRDQKKVAIKPDAEDIAMAKSMGISVEDYMKTIAASEKGTPAKKKTKEPLATEKNDQLIDDIIGAPNVSSKTKSKIKTITKETQAKQDAAIQKSEEIDSTTDDINDKLDEDLCI